MGSEEMIDSRPEARKEQDSLEHLLPQSRNKFREHGSSNEAAIDQICNYLVIKIDSCKTTLNT